MSKIYFLLLFSLVLLTACFKMDKEVYVVVKEPRESVGIHANMDDDTLHIYDLTTIYYTADIERESISRSQVFANGKRVLTYRSRGSVHFEIDPHDYGTGYYDLEILITLQSGTESLADKMGAESIEMSDKKILHIDINHPTNTLTAEFVIEEGKSLIRWNKPDVNNLLCYKLIRKFGTYYDWDTVSIEDSNVTEFHEEYYAGGPLRIKVLWEGYDYQILSNEINVDIKTQDDLVFTINEKNEIVFSWENLRLYGNNFDFALSAYGGRSFYQSFPAVDRNTQFVDVQPIYFGEVRTYRAYFNQDNRQYLYFTDVEAYVGSRIPKFTNLFYFKDKNVIVTYDNNYSESHSSWGRDYYLVIYKFDFTTMELLDSIKIETHDARDYEFYSSEDGNHFYIIKDNDLFKLDVDKMEMNNYSAPNALDPVSEIRVGNISNDNLIAFRTVGFNRVVNLSNGEVLYEGYPYSYPPLLSDDSEYLYAHAIPPDPANKYFISSVFMKSESGYEFKGSLKHKFSSNYGGYPFCYFFMEENTHKIIGKLNDENTFYTYNLDDIPGSDGFYENYETSTDLEIIFSSPFIKYDKFTHNFYGRADDGYTFVVYDANNWSLIYQRAPVAVSNSITYRNGKIFSTSGLYIDN